MHFFFFASPCPERDGGCRDPPSLQLEQWARGFSSRRSRARGGARAQASLIGQLRRRPRPGPSPCMMIHTALVAVVKQALHAARGEQPALTARPREVRGCGERAAPRPGTDLGRPMRVSPSRPRHVLASRAAPACRPPARLHESQFGSEGAQPAPSDTMGRARPAGLGFTSWSPTRTLHGTVPSTAALRAVGRTCPPCPSVRSGSSGEAPVLLARPLPSSAAALPTQVGRPATRALMKVTARCHL